MKKLCTWMTIVLAMTLVGACGSSSGGGGSGGGGGVVPAGDAGTACPAGMVQKFDSSTGAAYCEKSAGGSTTDAGSTGGGDTCPAGTVKKFDPNTGKPFCEKTGGAATTDAGSTGGGTKTDAGSGGGTPAPTGWCGCPPEKKNPAGALHGKKCEKDADCMYDRCVTGGFLAGYDDTIKFCSKNNNCPGGGDLTQCQTDGKFKAAFEKTKSSGNDKSTEKTLCGVNIKACAKTCKSDAECISWNPEMPKCSGSTKYISVGTQNICTKS